LCLLSSELGQWLYRKISERWPERDEDKSQIDMAGFIIGSVFGLFAFIVGFTFTIALDRYDSRRLIVIEEANAIEASFDRAELIDDAQRYPLQIMLRAYAHTRISPEGFWDAEKQAQLEQSQHLRERLWDVTRTSVLPYRGTDLGVSIAESMNEVLNVGSRRELVSSAHIPDRIMDALIFYLFASS